MNDISETFTDRFLKVQLIVEPPAPPPPVLGGGGPRGGPTKRYNALGILEDIPEEESPAASSGSNGDSVSPTPAPAGEGEVLDVGPAEPPKKKVVARQDPVVVGAGRARSLNPAAPTPTGPVDWSNVGRNDPCPCGSGKKFKKCHGANL